MYIPPRVPPMLNDADRKFLIRLLMSLIEDDQQRRALFKIVYQFEAAPLDLRGTARDVAILAVGDLSGRTFQSGKNGVVFLIETLIDYDYVGHSERTRLQTISDGIVAPPPPPPPRVDAPLRVEPLRIDVERYYQTLLEAEQEKSWSEVIELGEAIIAADPIHRQARKRTANAYRERGVSYHNKGDYDRAIADFNRALELAPDTADYYKSRGVSYSMKGDEDRAIADKTRAIELAPNTADYYKSRGVSYHNKGDYDRAIADFSRALELAPNTADYHYSRGVSYSMKGDEDRAIADFNRALELAPNTADYHYSRGVSYSMKGDEDRAIADYNRAI
jgi:tetratricopeptide (TPR) repeat protein